MEADLYFNLLCFSNIISVLFPFKHPINTATLIFFDIDTNQHAFTHCCPPLKLITLVYKNIPYKRHFFNAYLIGDILYLF